MDSHLRELCDCVATLLGRPNEGAAVPQPSAQRAAPAGDPLPSALLERLSAALAQFIGPIADHVVRRAAVPGRSEQDVVNALALELEDDRERKQFLMRCGAALR
jgi:hypothetical protein